MTILINYTGKFCYQHGYLKNSKNKPPELLLKVSQNSQERNYARVARVTKKRPATLFK